MTTNNLFADLPLNTPDELFAILLDDANVRIERIVSHGHASPEGFWYNQNQHEWVVLLKGAAALRFEDQMVEMKPGDVGVHRCSFIRSSVSCARTATAANEN